MPRPTLERTLRYMPVVPRANSKLAREARRGSHDLRKLVGHANFLDTLMYELDVGCVEDDDGADATATATASSGPSQRMHGSDLQNDAEWETESSGDEGEEDEAITPEFDHEDDEEHALGRVQSHGVDKRPVRTISVVTPGLEHPTAGAKERLEEEDEAAVINANADKGIRIVVSEATEGSKDYFGNIVTEREFVAAVKVQ